MTPTSPDSILVTGLSGFVGAHMLEMQDQLLHAYGLRIVPVEHAYDLCNQAEVDALVEATTPDYVIHLAAQSNVPAAFKDPEATLRINVLGTLHLLQSLDRYQFTGRFLYVSSGDIYGELPEAVLPVEETWLPRPVNPYAVSKLSAEALCLQWGITSGYQTLIARPFNHIGPGQRPDFVIPSIAQQIAQSRDPGQILVGDIDITRDFLDVRDVIHAYCHLLKQGQPGKIYNVCSGQERKIRDLANVLIMHSRKQLTLVQDPSRFRPADQRRVSGSNKRLQQDTGWMPRYSVEQTLQDILQSFNEQ